MQEHKQIQLYVGLEEGGCVDVGAIKLDGFTLIATSELEALKAERDALAAQIKMIRNIFRDESLSESETLRKIPFVIDMTPDQCLREIEAKAGRKGFIAGVNAISHAKTFGVKFDRDARADEYAATVRNDGMQNGNSQKTEETELQKAIRLLNGEWPENQWSSKSYVYLIHMPSGGGGGYATTHLPDYAGYKYICTRKEFELEAAKVRQGGA